MVFLQKKPQVSSSAPFYTLGLNKTILIVGLGNVGKHYDGTRHNIGFACVDAFASANEFPAWIEKKDLSCHFASKALGDTRIILIKPTTLMNLSGKAVRATMGFYKITGENVVVVHDELDIPFGQIRTRRGGTSAGHNGVQSIIEQVGEDFGRIRIGISPKTPGLFDSANFVLTKFSEVEVSNISLLIREVTAILGEYVYGGQVLPHETRNFIV